MAVSDLYGLKFSNMMRIILITMSWLVLCTALIKATEANLLVGKNLDHLDSVNTIRIHSGVETVADTEGCTSKCSNCGGMNGSHAINCNRR